MATLGLIAIILGFITLLWSKISSLLSAAKDAKLDEAVKAQKEVSDEKVKRADESADDFLKRLHDYQSKRDSGSSDT